MATLQPRLRSSNRGHSSLSATAVAEDANPYENASNSQELSGGASDSFVLFPSAAAHSSSLQPDEAEPLQAASDGTGSSSLWEKIDNDPAASSMSSAVLLSSSSLSSSSLSLSSPSATPRRSSVSSSSHDSMSLFNNTTTTTTTATFSSNNTLGLLPAHDGQGYFEDSLYYSSNSANAEYYHHRMITSNDNSHNNNNAAVSSPSPSSSSAASLINRHHRTLSMSTSDGLSKISSLDSNYYYSPSLLSASSPTQSHASALFLDNGIEQLDELENNDNGRIDVDVGSSYFPPSPSVSSSFGALDDPVISIGKKRRKNANRRSLNNDDDRSSKRSNTSQQRLPLHVQHQHSVTSSSTSSKAMNRTSSTASSSSVLKTFANADNNDIMEKLFLPTPPQSPPIPSSLSSKRHSSYIPSSTPSLNTYSAFYERYADELDPFSMPVVWRNAARPSLEDEEEEDINDDDDDDDDDDVTVHDDSGTGTTDLARSHSLSSLPHRFLRSIFASSSASSVDLTRSALASNSVNINTSVTSPQSSSANSNFNDKPSTTHTARLRRASSLPALSNQHLQPETNLDPLSSTMSPLSASSLSSSATTTNPHSSSKRSYLRRLWESFVSSPPPPSNINHHHHHNSFDYHSSSIPI